jgi:hypothetical protein
MSRIGLKVSLLLSTVALMWYSACAVLVENRYSVFGFDVMQTDSVRQARFWTWFLLSSVALCSALLGGVSFWLAQRWVGRAKARSESETNSSEAPRKHFNAENLQARID